MILLIDNYDSFTYNLKQYVEELGHDCVVHRNDAISLREIEALAPKRIIISPGPGTPDSAGITLALISHFSGKIPILGVCLGHQAIGQAFGGRVVRAPTPMHGKISVVNHVCSGVFENLSRPLRVARYHSLVVERSSLPSCLEVTAESEDGLVMALRHRAYVGGHAIEGVQFHPESIATENGHQLLSNFLGKP
jgi:anthranilate synthase component 2